MMRNCKAPGNRACKGITVSKAGVEKVPSYRSLRTLRYAAVIALVAAAVIAPWCDLPKAAGLPRVILLRGWFGVFSMGLDSVTDQLKAQGINAEVAGHLSWQDEVGEILRERAAGRTGPLILVGHSQGANNVIDMARLLASSHVTVDLLITLSPFMQNRVPLNVAKAIN